LLVITERFEPSFGRGFIGPGDFLSRWCGGGETCSYAATPTPGYRSPGEWELLGVSCGPGTGEWCGTSSCCGCGSGSGMMRTEGSVGRNKFDCGRRGPELEYSSGTDSRPQRGSRLGCLAGGGA